MKLIARIREHDIASPSGLPVATLVEISGDDGYYFIRFSETRFAGDSWFSTLDECKRQGKFEFGIEENDWELVS